MIIRFQCECGEKLRISDEYAGQQGECPTCQGVITIPEKTSVQESSSGSNGVGEEADSQAPHEEMPQEGGFIGEAGWEAVQEELPYPKGKQSRLRSPKFLKLVGGLAVLLVAIVAFIIVRNKEESPEKGVAYREATPPPERSEKVTVPPIETQPKKATSQPEVTLPMRTGLTPQEETIEETTAGKPGVEKERLNQELTEGRGEVEQKEGRTAENPDSREEVGPLPGPSQETIAETPKFEQEEGDQEVAETEEQREQKVAILEEKPGPVPGSYTVNIASFRVKARADRLVQELRKKGLEAFGWEVDLPEKGKWHRVAVGNFPTLKYAEDFVIQERLRENYSVFITRIPGT